MAPRLQQDNLPHRHYPLPPRHPGGQARAGRGEPRTSEVGAGPARTPAYCTRCTSSPSSRTGAPPCSPRTSPPSRTGSMTSRSGSPSSTPAGAGSWSGRTSASGRGRGCAMPGSAQERTWCTITCCRSGTCCTNRREGAVGRTAGIEDRERRGRRHPMEHGIADRTYSYGGIASDSIYDDVEGEATANTCASWLFPFCSGKNSQLGLDSTLAPTRFQKVEPQAPVRQREGVHPLAPQRGDAVHHSVRNLSRTR